MADDEGPSVSTISLGEKFLQALGTLPKAKASCGRRGEDPTPTILDQPPPPADPAADCRCLSKDS